MVSRLVRSFCGGELHSGMPTTHALRSISDYRLSSPHPSDIALLTTTFNIDTLHIDTAPRPMHEVRYETLITQRLELSGEDSPLCT